jgi:hypothetical protein
MNKPLNLPEITTYVCEDPGPRMKKLSIAMLRENFRFLDYWERRGPAARNAVKTRNDYFKSGGTNDIRQWPNDMWRVNAVLGQFSWELENIFGWQLDQRQWENCLDALDPAKPLPEKIPLFSTTPHTVIGVEDDAHKPIETPAKTHLNTIEGYLAKLGEDVPAEVRDMLYKDAMNPHGSLYPIFHLKSSERLLKVDLSRKKSELLTEFKAFLDQVYENQKSDDIPENWKTNYKQWTPDTSRESAKVCDQLKVWKMRKEKIPFSEIAKGLKITQDAAKKAFYKAYERTQGREYDREKYRKYGQKMNPWDMTKTCQTCPDRQTCSELCPEIMRVVDQDYTGRKEALDDKGITDFKQYEGWQEQQKKHHF